MIRLSFIVVLLFSAGANSLAGAETPPPATAEQVRNAIQRGIDFLLQDQNPDGSWGGPQDSITTWSGSTWPNPESHRAWKVATTGLCCAALYETATAEAALEAADRGVRYLIENADVRRPNEWDTMNNWAYIYGLQGLAAAHGHPRHDASELQAHIAEAVPKYLRDLARFQSLHGGWGYLEFGRPRTRRPQWGTSFTTAAAIVALEQVKHQGFDVDQAMVDRAVRAVQRCHLPNGGYAYSIAAIPMVRMERINEIKGSLARVEVCQAALMSGGKDVPVEQLETGLGHFFREHRFLDIAVLKPVPHEAYYQNSGYFYLFGHYYAALVIDRLSSEAQAEFWPKLQHEILKMQQRDGSIWDYDMHRYDRPYGAAFGIMTLHHSLAAWPADITAAR